MSLSVKFRAYWLTSSLLIESQLICFHCSEPSLAKVIKALFIALKTNNCLQTSFSSGTFNSMLSSVYLPQL